jgi:2-keto-4-pentenoate hydratase/2-oxohepta-3-ene-1,7-dioic acid hydratase in catechol pathway
VKIVVFGDEGRVGALDGDHVVDLNRGDAAIPARLDAFIQAGQPALELADRALRSSSAALPLDQIRLRSPWPGRRIACMGGNYADHLLGMEPAAGEATLESVTAKTRGAGQWGFWKVLAETAGPEDPIVYPRRTEYFDYEAEAAIVIGKRGKDIRAADLAEYVWGVTLFNDWSIRDGMGGPQRPMSYNIAKNFDGSASLGPCIVVGEVDPSDVDVQLCINGQVRQRYNTRDMIFSFGEALEYLSRDFTFVPGDIIAGGTAAGTAADKTKRGPDGVRPKDLFLKVNDVVEITSPQIGTLRNRVVAA